MDKIYNFISPITGRIICKKDYILVGDYQNIANKSSKLIDLNIDLINLRSNLVKNFSLLNGYIWIGNNKNKPEAKKTLNLNNMPQIGAALFPEPSGLISIPLPNPTFNPLSGFDWLMSGAWLPQIFAGNAGKIDPTGKSTVESSALAMTQIKTAQAIKRLDHGNFIVKNKNISFTWENPAMSLIPEAVKSLYDLNSSYTFTNAQALDELNVQEGQYGILRVDSAGNLSIANNIVPNDARFILQIPNDSLPNAQALNLLGGGMLKANEQGIISIARGGDNPVTDDYVLPINLQEEALERAEEDIELGILIADLADYFVAQMAPYIPAPLVTSGAQIAASIVLAEAAAVTQANQNMSLIKVYIDSNDDSYSQMTGSGYVTPQGHINQHVAITLKKHVEILKESVANNHSDEYVNYQHFYFENQDEKPSIFAISSNSDAPKPMSFGLMTSHTISDVFQPRGKYERERGFTLDATFNYEGEGRHPSSFALNLLKYRDNKYYNHEDDEIENIFIYERALDLFLMNKAFTLIGGNVYPEHRKAGTLWFNTNNSKLEYFNGTEWVTTSPSTGVRRITAGTGLNGGVITNEGTISLSDTSVSEGIYKNATITVNKQGRITNASSGSSGEGTVTSVGIKGGDGITVTNSPITDSGTIDISLEVIPIEKLKDFPNDATKYLDGSGKWSSVDSTITIDEDIYLLLQIINDEVI